MRYRVKRYKVIILSASGKHLSFTVPAWRKSSILSKVVKYLEKKTEKSVVFEGKNLLIDGKRIGTISSITVMKDET